VQLNVIPAGGVFIERSAVEWWPPAS